MRKFLVIILLLFPLNVNAYYYTWSSDVIAVYDFENNANDTSGNGYNATLFGNTNAYSNTNKKINNYSYHAYIGYHPTYITLPQTLLQKMSMLLKFSFSFYQYNYDVGNQSGIMGGTNGYFNTACVNISGWTPNNKMSFFSWTNMAINVPSVPDPYDDLYYQKWGRTQYEYDGTGTTKYLKVYFEGNLTFSTTTTTPSNVFKLIYDNSGEFRVGQFIGSSDSRIGYVYIDQLIFSDKLYNGAEIVPVGVIETEYFEPTNIKYIGDIW